METWKDKKNYTINMPCIVRTLKSSRKRGCTGTCLQAILIAVLIITLVFNIIFILDNRTRFRGTNSDDTTVREADENRHIKFDRNEDLHNKNPVRNVGKFYECDVECIYLKHL